MTIILYRDIGPLFTNEGLESIVLSEEGEFLKEGTPFTEEQDMLDYIFRSQHREILDEIDKKKKKIVRDEL